MANFMSFNLEVVELFDDALRELKTVLIVNKLNTIIKLNGMAHYCIKLMNLIQYNVDTHS